MAEAAETRATGTKESGGGRPAVRERWLDAMRGMAVLGMIHTHTVNMLLADEWRRGEAFTRLVFVSGLVAPAFLWIAGHAHGVVARRRAGREWVARTVRRLLFILALGYVIHLPLPGTGATWTLFFAVDVLQCLAVSLLVVVGVQHWWPRWAAVILSGMTAGVLALGAIPPEVLNTAIHFWPLGAWIDQSGQSLFPLVPWAAFVFIGVLMAGWRMPWWGWGLLGMGLLALPSPPYMFKSHPTFFAERCGWLLLAASVIRGVGQVMAFPRWLEWMGRESLALYLVHLGLLYVLPVARWIGPRLHPVETALVAVGLAGVSAGLVLAWRRHGGRTLTPWRRGPQRGAVPPAG